MFSSILNGLKDYINIEINNPSGIFDEVQNVASKKLSSYAQKMIFKDYIEPEQAKDIQNIDLSKYVKINLTDKAKKYGLIFGGLILLWLFIRKR